MFSVIVPYYKNSAIVGRCLDSLARQTETDFEVWLVDDGSEDDIDTIVNRYNDSRFHVVHKPNGGPASARNCGIDLARHEYVCFLDSDDEWLPDHLATLKQMIEAYPEAGMYFTSNKKMGNSMVLSASRLPDNERECFPIGNLFKVHYENGSIVHTNSVCLSKKLISRVGLFDTSSAIGEDSDMWFRCALVTTPIASRRVTTIYHRDFSTLTKKNRHAYRWAFLRQYPNLQSRNDEIGYYARVLCERHILATCKHLLADGKKEECRQELKRLPKTLCREMRNNYLFVRCTMLLPHFVLMFFGRLAFANQLKKY